LNKQKKKYSKELTQIENKINQVSDILAKLNESEIHHRKWEDENILLNNTLKSLRKSLEETKNEISKLQNELSLTETRGKHYHQVIETAELTIPKLQNDKAKAVSNENYVEAGRIHSLIKAKEEQKEKSIKDLQEVTDKRAEFDAQIQQLNKKQASIEEDLVLVLKKIDKLRFELLVNCRITITEQLNQLMQEMNDRNHNANEAESTVLQCELDQYNEEIDKLSKQYGWRMEDLLLAAQAAQAKQEKQNMTSNIDIAQSNDNNSNKVTTPINNNVSKKRK